MSQSCVSFQLVIVITVAGRWVAQELSCAGQDLVYVAVSFLLRHGPFVNPDVTGKHRMLHYFKNSYCYSTTCEDDSSWLNLCPPELKR